MKYSKKEKGGLSSHGQRPWVFPAVLYKFDYTAAKETGAIRTFDGANAKWLDYVTANRAKKHHGPIHGIDVGPVADDDATRTIKLYQ